MHKKRALDQDLYILYIREKAQRIANPFGAFSE
jgi:hypothetical protein